MMMPYSANGIVVIAGVAGSGKSSAGRALADELGVPFMEGDDAHPAANIAKMRAGTALNDTDRAPWLDRIAEWIATRRVAGTGGVVSCSALRRRYRDRLRRAGGDGLRFVLLDPDEATLRARLAARTGHFMPAAMLAGQIATLERPADEPDTIVIAGDPGIPAICRRIIDVVRTPCLNRGEHRSFGSDGEP